MREFFIGFREGFSEPFVWLFRLLLIRPLYRLFPKFFDRIDHFLNDEPEENELAEVVSRLVQNKDYRDQLIVQFEDFRAHLIRAVLALVVTVGVSFFFTERAIQYLAQPVGGLNALRSIDMTESVGAFMRVAMFLGITLAVPYIAFELWRFAAPGLKPRARKMGLWGIPLATIFFLFGAAFTFYVMLPAALPFLMNFLGMKTEPRPDSYFAFVTGLMFWIGLFFEYPLVIYVLSSIGWVKPEHLVQHWRLAIVIITIAAAAITPTIDPINQALVMAPMIALYFLSIGFSKIAYAGRQRNQEETQKKADEAQTA